MNHTSTRPTNETTTAAASRGVPRALADLGTEWAAFGLEQGVSALNQSARTLHLAADTLTAILESLVGRKRRPSETVAVEVSNAPDSRPE